jgi:molybdenum cofactor cytidylyltransferase
MNNCAIIILAAGSSSRLGYPKQLVLHNNESLIRRAVSSALEVSNHVVVVLGANTQSVQDEIKDLPVEVAHNGQWEEGMASSIRCGISCVSSGPDPVDAAVIMVCDQPFVDACLLQTLISTYAKSNQPIVACTYKETMGTPVLFDKSLFRDLLALDGNSGAKQLIAKNREAVAIIPFPLGYVDIDTERDYENLQNNLTKP